MASGFRDVRRMGRDRGAAGEQAVQGLLNQPGAVAVPGGIAIGGAPGSVGETSPNFHDDPIVNALVKLPSLEEAKRYTGADPSFYGVQRPGDWQRVVQREMAADKVGSHEGLGRLIENSVNAAKHRAGDSSASSSDVARAMGANYTATQEGIDKREGALQRRLAARFAS